MPEVSIVIKGIPNDGGLMDINLFKIDKECDVIVINEPDLPYALLKMKLKRMKLKKRDRERLIQNAINRDMEYFTQEAEKEAENEEEESEEEENVSEDSDQEDEEEEEESDDEAKKKKLNKKDNNEEKESKNKKEETKEEKYEKLRKEKEKKEQELSKVNQSKQKGVLSLIKSKIDDTKNATKISKSLNMDNDDEPEISKVPDRLEEYKKKERDVIQKLKDDQANLFKESLNKTKPYYKDIEKFDVIAEANSNEEVSTVRQSLIGGERLETTDEPKAMLESLGYNKSTNKSNQKKDKISENANNITGESKHDSSQKSKSDADKRSSQSKLKQELKAKISEDEEISGIVEEDIKNEDLEENISAEGEESEKEEQSESEPSDKEIEYEKPVFPSRRHAKYFERIKNKKGYENKILLVNFQYKGDYEFFLKKLYYFYTLKPMMIIISYDENEKLIKQYFLNRLSEINDIRVVLVKQCEKQQLIEAMTVNIGKKKIRNVIYSWGCASFGKLGLGKIQNLENASDFQVACPIHFTREYNDLINSSSLGKKGINLENNYRKHLFTHVPQVILSIWGQEFKSIRCGLNHSVALTESNEGLYVWGDNTFSQLGFSIENKEKNIEITVSQTPTSVSSPRDKFSSAAVSQAAKMSSVEGHTKAQYIYTPKLHPKFDCKEDSKNIIHYQKVCVFCNENSTHLLCNIETNAS